MSALIDAPQTETIKSTAQIVKDSYKSKIHPDWCPGCGDFSVLSALQTALFELGLKPHQVVVISGIGCSSNLPGFINTFGMHTLHGRALAVASGAQLANHSLKVIVTGGDGDGYGIGGNHLLHAMRRNLDVTYVVMDNQIYGLTTGQVSPTSVKGMKTKSTPTGNVDNPINPIPLAIAAGATYVARGYTGQVRHLTDLIKGGIQHRGFALIDCFSPCVTFNRDNTQEFFKQKTVKLDAAGHDVTDFQAAMQRGYEWGDEIPIGLFWQRTDLPALHELEPVLERGPVAAQPLGIDAETARSLVEELM